VLALGAHADDIEIGAAGLIDRLVAEHAGLETRWLVASAEGVRAVEARASFAGLLGDRGSSIELGGFPDGYLPFHGEPVKRWVAGHAGFQPDIVLAPWRGDAHQDHRLLGELAWQVYRDAMILEYEILKYDGDLGRPNLYVDPDEAAAERKVRRILEGVPSQTARPWFTGETFRSMLRIRGVESAAPGGYAEAFHAAKLRF